MDSTNLLKYPRTPHLPWSRSRTDDDKVLTSTDHFLGQSVVVTEKLDGENTTMLRAHCHARSLDSKHHPSRNYVKGIWGRIRHDLPEGWRFCGENVFATHSIHYTALTDYFYLIAVFDEQHRCLSWDETCTWAAMLSLQTVPVIWSGIYDEPAIQALWPRPSCFGAAESEGYVVRRTCGFHATEFRDYVAKFVRPHHVQTDEFWMNQPIVPNLLAGGGP
jgi:hypothetical protein